MSPDTESKLILRDPIDVAEQQTSPSAAPGDHQLFAAACDQYRAELFAIALRICGYERADDAIQDALITAYLKFHQLRDINAIRPWLKRITLNSCYQLMRKMRSKAEVPYGTQNFEPVEDSIERHIESLEERDHLYASLANISPVLKQPLILRYFSAYNSYAQIAEVLDIPVGTVRSRLSAGKAELVKQWHIDKIDPGIEVERSRQWNRYYKELMPAIHQDGAAFRELDRHLNGELEMVLTSGKRLHGKDKFIASIYDDLEHGSGIEHVSGCITSGEISVMRIRFSNSEEHPTHCPPGSLVVIERDDRSMKRLKLYHAPRPDLQVGSSYS
ncbi:RNA polymerase sigma factor [Mucilaginibacter terrae]|uniref:RNA polymerase sigma factor (Sigma-70 family) n=1 Tax=Mucilaginibacter terrae TaxID=1955052 RepID=A0ABU3GRF2_9SPHI|nr:RNA polymerase sigma factor [Mucilaginibacter terrae]MDT3402346.1 RNA polymerase sigma factor (sigma-70 family) [Mucilaginibacter terrae]